MSAFTKHLHVGHHAMHYLCVLAIAMGIGAAVLGAPVLALFGGLFCAAMMVGMVWMMATAALKRRR